MEEQPLQPQLEPQLTKKQIRAERRAQKQLARDAMARQKNLKKLFIWTGVVVIIAGLIGAWVIFSKQPGPYDGFASCIKESGAKFYGAFWCSHCQNQKKLFGRSDKLLPYIECSMPNGQSQTAACQAAKIESYPTWEFADGSRLTGELSFATLAEKTGCVAP